MVVFTITHCPADMSAKCPGHAVVDKFPDCLTEAVYGGMFDEETGTVDGFGVWVGLVIQEVAETINNGTDTPVTIPAGTFLIVTENDQGHIWVDTYPTAEAAQSAYDTWERLYAEWSEVAEAREAAITSSTGRVGW